jgi:hypothetical protein
VFPFLTQLLLPSEQCFIYLNNNELAGGTTLIRRTIVLCWKDAIRFGIITCHTKSRKMMETATVLLMMNLFIDKRKSLSMMVAKGVLNNGEHTLIPVMAKMIHSAVWDSERFILKDGRPLHMVKLVGAIRNLFVPLSVILSVHE